MKSEKEHRKESVENIEWVTEYIKSWIERSTPFEVASMELKKKDSVKKEINVDNCYVTDGKAIYHKTRNKYVRVHPKKGDE